MKTILLDTNIYGLALEKKEVADIMVFFINEKQKLARNFMILGSEIVYNEINANPHKEARTRLNELYQVVISGQIRLTDQIKSLAMDYLNEFKNNHLRITLEDCQIVAGSSIANVEFIVTENRKTMMGHKSIEVFNLINKKKGIKTPKLIGYDMLKSLLLSSGVS